MTALIIIVISTLALLMGIKFRERGNHLLENGKKAKGTVFKNNLETSGRGPGIYYPVVKFQTEEGDWITKALSRGGSRPMDEGTELDIVYDPDEPTNAERDSPVELNLIGPVLICVGILGIVFGALAYLDVIDLSSLTKSYPIR